MREDKFSFYSRTYQPARKCLSQWILCENLYYLSMAFLRCMNHENVIINKVYILQGTYYQCKRIYHSKKILNNVFYLNKVYR